MVQSVAAAGEGHGKVTGHQCELGASVRSVDRFESCIDLAERDEFVEHRTADPADHDVTFGVADRCPRCWSGGLILHWTIVWCEIDTPNHIRAEASQRSWKRASFAGLTMARSSATLPSRQPTTDNNEGFSSRTM